MFFCAPLQFLPFRLSVPESVAASAWALSQRCLVPDLLLSCVSCSRASCPPRARIQDFPFPTHTSLSPAASDTHHDLLTRRRPRSRSPALPPQPRHQNVQIRCCDESCLSPSHAGSSVISISACATARHHRYTRRARPQLPLIVPIDLICFICKVDVADSLVFILPKFISALALLPSAPLSQTAVQLNLIYQGP